MENSDIKFNEISRYDFFCARWLENLTTLTWRHRLRQLTHMSSTLLSQFKSKLSITTHSNANRMRTNKQLHIISTLSNSHLQKFGTPATQKCIVEFSILSRETFNIRWFTMLSRIRRRCKQNNIVDGVWRCPNFSVTRSKRPLTFPIHPIVLLNPIVLLQS